MARVKTFVNGGTLLPTDLNSIQDDYAAQIAAAIAGAQPLDSDLTSIAALTTTAFGRSVLTQADAAAVRTLISALQSGGVGAIGTTDIANSAVTPGKRSSANYATTTGAGTLSTPAGTGNVNCLSCSFTSTGRPVLVVWSCDYYNANSGNTTLTGSIGAMLDATTFLGVGMRTIWAPYISGQGPRYSKTGVGIIVPSAASHSYGLYVQTNVGSAMTFENGEISAIEL